MRAHGEGRGRWVVAQADTCPACGAALPVGALVSTEPHTEDEPASWPLAARDHLIGRSRQCDISLGTGARLSREHARLHWSGGGFEIADAGSTNGTLLNGRRLEKGEKAGLADGDVVGFGETSVIYRSLLPGRSGPSHLPYHRFLDQIRAMISLDPAEVVRRALELLQFVSGVDRAYFVSANTARRLAAFMTPLDDSSLRVSRSAIEEAIRTAKKVVRFIQPGQREGLTESINDLQLRRVWVSPVLGAGGRPVAAVYLDSKVPGEVFDHETELLMDAVVDQIAIALRNAALHSEVVELNETLEQKVAERTRQLEESKARLIGQDRLATLGRLVAAIAHELNNPVGAMASLSETLRGLQRPLLSLGEEIAKAFPEPDHAQQARRLMEQVLDAASSTSQDTRARRAMEQALEKKLQAEGIPGAVSLARSLSKAGLGEEAVAESLPLLKAQSGELAGLLERMHTFARGLRTIGECGRSVARIVDGLKTYAHLDQAEFEVADIHQGIQATLSVLAPRIPPGITVETRFAEIPPFAHRPGELTQVWTNLVDNSLHAMGESGKLSITTEESGGDAVVRVEDTGAGIPEGIRDRIFDLDATTRGPGAGLGLGLPICKTIVEKTHGGSITFESRPGRTVFAVRVPRYPKPKEGASR